MQSPPQLRVRRLQALLRLVQGDREVLIAIERVSELRRDTPRLGRDGPGHGSARSWR